MVSSSISSEEAALPGQGRFGQVLAEGDELGRVLRYPVLDVVPGHQVPDPAPAVLRSHVDGSVGQVGDRVHQRGAERQGQAR